MSEQHPTPDELVSAYLDGEATAEERARVEREPLLQERLAEFASVRDAVRASAPAPLDERRREELLRRVAGAAMAPTNVRPLRRRLDRAKVFAAAAAVVAVAFLGGAVALLQVDGDGGDDSGDASTAGGAEVFQSTAGDDGDGAADMSAGAPGEDSATTIGSAEALPEYLGEFTDPDELREVATDRSEGQRTAADAPTEAEMDAGTVTLSDAAACASTFGTGTVFRAGLDGEPVFVVVTDDAVTILRATDCTVLATFAR
jgi:hypothetical protein